MIAGLMERVQAGAGGRIPQTDIEYCLELIIARANATVVEAECNRRHQSAGLLIWDHRWRIDADELCCKCDLLARRGRLIVHNVENAFRAAREGRVYCLRDIVDVNAVRNVTGLVDAVHVAAQQTHHCVSPRTIDAAEPQDRNRQVSPRAECLPLELRIDPRSTPARKRGKRAHRLVDPCAATIPVDSERGQIDEGLKPRRQRDLISKRGEHGIAAFSGCRRYEQRIGIGDRDLELARCQRAPEKQHFGGPARETFLPEHGRLFRAARRSNDALETRAEFAQIMSGTVAKPDANERGHQAAACSAAVHSSATNGSSCCVRRCVAIVVSCSAAKRRPSAQTAAPRTSAEESSNSRIASGASAASPELPIAISTLRTKRSRPVRLIGDFENSLRNAASSRRARSARRGAVNS